MNEQNSIEVCAAHIQSALAAQDGGASRIELCDNLYEGGTTPSYATIKRVREKLDIGLNVMIRPRGSDFCYNDLEIEIMKQDIQLCKELGANGVVFGVLLPDGNVDVSRMKQLVEISRPLEVTFHRAFDVTPDPYRAMEETIDLGIERILTAGQKNTVPEGLELIKNLIQRADNRIIIMPGSGINQSNIKKIKDYSGATEFHLTGRKSIQSKMNYRPKGIFFGGLPQIPEYEIKLTNSNIIQRVVASISD